MSVPGISRLFRVSIILQIWHLAFMHFFAGNGWCSGDSCHNEYLLMVGRLSICAVVQLNNCLAAGMLL